MTSRNQESDRPGLVPAGSSIERKSFEIIDGEMGDHDFPHEQWEIVRRIIHTTGDFEFAETVRLHPEALTSATAALQRGSTIYADTRMIQVGLSPWRLSWFGNPVNTPAADPETHIEAEKLGVTRSVAAFRSRKTELNGSIIAIGNAPTALLEVIRLVREESIEPALVIGVPVGFVQAAESKQSLWELEAQPSITVLGRKGGSTIAVAILHALLEIAKSGANPQGA